MADKWPSPWVARTEVEKFSGGIIDAKYLANLDSSGRGPSGKVRCGRKVVYSVAELVAWLEARSSVIPEKKSRKLS